MTYCTSTHRFSFLTLHLSQATLPQNDCLHMNSNLLNLPCELRTRIYHYCFPPPHSHIQLIPYRSSSPTCHLNLPLSLYLVCKAISAELPPLPAQVRKLDFVFIIQGSAIGRAARPDDEPRADDDLDLRHFHAVLAFAERIRLVGAGAAKAKGKTGAAAGGRSIQSASRRLTAGDRCALKILEVQPRSWNKRVVTHTILSCLGPVAVHPDVAERLEVRWIGDEEDEDEAGSDERNDDVKDWLKRYQDLGKGGDLSRRFSTNGLSSDL